MLPSLNSAGAMQSMVKAESWYASENATAIENFQGMTISS